MSTRVKRAVVTGAVMFLAAAGGIAVAFWTAGGQGEGQATTGDTAPVVVTQRSVVADLRPGGAPQPLSGDFDNPNDGPVQVSHVTVAIAGIVKADGAVGSCDATDYALSGARMDVGRQVPVGEGVGSWSGATLAFANKADVNQDGCKGATVQLAYTAY